MLGATLGIRPIHLLAPLPLPHPQSLGAACAYRGRGGREKTAAAAAVVGHHPPRRAHKLSLGEYATPTHTHAHTHIYTHAGGL